MLVLFTVYMNLNWDSHPPFRNKLTKWDIIFNRSSQQQVWIQTMHNYSVVEIATKICSHNWRPFQTCSFEDTTPPNPRGNIWWFPLFPNWWYTSYWNAFLLRFSFKIWELYMSSCGWCPPSQCLIWNRWTNILSLLIPLFRTTNFEWRICISGVLLLGDCVVSECVFISFTRKKGLGPWCKILHIMQMSNHWTETDL